METPAKNPASARLILRTLCFVSLASLLMMHFLMTLAVTLPPTPLTVQYSKKIDAWIYPYFNQNWSFFAPDPPTEDEFLIVQYRFKSADGMVSESPWINLSRTFNEAVQRNRLSPLEIVQLTILNASGDLVRSEIFKNGRLDNDLLTRLVSTNRQPPSLHTLERIAMGCAKLARIQGEPVAVRIGLLHHQFPRFTHRSEPDNPQYDNTEIVFPFVPFEAVASL